MSRSKHSRATSKWTKRYQGAIRAIRSRHGSATYRDAQAIYRTLRKESARPLTASSVRSTSKATTSRLLTRARDLGSRTFVLTKKEQARENKRAARFNPDNKRKERARHGKKEKPTRGKSGKGATARGRRGQAEGGDSAPDRETYPREGFTVETADGDVDIDSPEAFDEFVDEYSGEFDDVEIETSPDYSGE